MGKTKQTDIGEYSILLISSKDGKYNILDISKTTNIRNYKHYTKVSSQENSGNTNYLSTIIRANGGFDNFTFTILDKIVCSRKDAEVELYKYRQKTGYLIDKSDTPNTIEFKKLLV